MSDHIAVTSPVDLVAVVPYLIGFHPDPGSLVLIADYDRRIVFGSRATLPAPGTSPQVLDRYAARLAAVLDRYPVTAISLIGYGPADRVDAVLAGLTARRALAGIPIRGMVRVDGDRVIHLSCRSRCCPPSGTRLDPAAPAAVQAIIAGHVALPDRAAVAANVAADTGPGRDRMDTATYHAAQWVIAAAGDGTDLDRTGDHAIRSALAAADRGQRLDDTDTARLSVLLARPAVFDTALTCTRADQRHVDLWADITRRAHPALAAPPAVLCALTAWRCGNGVLAAFAADRALAIEPDDPLAGAIRAGLQAGLSPEVIASFFDPTRPGSPERS